MVDRLIIVMATLVLCGSTATAQPTIPFKSRELQEGKNFIQRLSTSLATGESSGQASYTFPVELPTGRGVTPAVELQYTSGGALTEYGHGWELTVPMIERSDRDRAPGIPYLFEDTYRYRNGQQTVELARTATNLDGWIVYRERSERSFNRYLFKNNTWRILTPSGVRYELGNTAFARNGMDLGLGEAGTAAWLVTRIFDTSTNFAEYTYGIDTANTARLIQILYNGNTAAALAPSYRVSFAWQSHWGPSADVPFSYRSGYERRFGTQRLAAITIEASSHSTVGSPAQVPAGTSTTKVYQLTYSSPVGLDRQFHLIGIKPGSLPLINFDYNATTASGEFVRHFEYILDPNPAPPTELSVTDTYIASSTETVSKVTRVFVDLNSDARPDMLEVNCGAPIAYINTPGRLARQQWAAITAPNLPLPDTCALKSTSTDTVRSLGDSLTTQDFLDIDGNGYPDIVYIKAGMLLYCPGTGTGFDSCRTYSTTLPSGGFLRRDTVTANYTSTTTDLQDLNADGLVDSVSVSGNAMLIRWNKGPGLGFDRELVTVSAPTCLPGVPIAILSCLRFSQSMPGPGPNRRLLAELRDINGDGLPDFLATPSGDPSTVHVAFGHTHIESDDPMFSPLRPLAQGPGFVGTGNQGGGDYRALQDLVDVNGDGLPDAVTINPTPLPSIAVRMNLGGGVWDQTAFSYAVRLDDTGPQQSYYPAALSRMVEVSAPSGVQSRVVNVSQFADMDGDGLPDFISSLIPGAVPRTLMARFQPYRAPRRLIRVRAVSDNSSANLNYTSVNGTAPYPLHVVSSAVRSRAPLYAGESSRLTTSSTTYQYTGMTFDRNEREFTSFARVVAVGDAFATTTTTDFETSIWMAGLVKAQETRNNQAASVPSNVKYVRSLQQLGACSGSADYCFWPRLDQTSDLTSGQKTTYETHDSYGNPIAWRVWGSPVTPHDDILYTRTYVTRVDSNHVLNLVSSEGGEGSNGEALSRTRFHYDGAYATVPSRGMLTKRERERITNVYVSTSSQYDGVGNVITESDELGQVATHAYDTTHRRFRVRTVSPGGTVHRSFHALTGAALDECGPQYSGTSWRCTRAHVDEHGRITASYTSALTGGIYSKTLLKEFAYNDLAYPLQVVMTARGNARTVEYSDGFGNPVQLRVEEQPNNFRVYTTAYDAYGYAITQQGANRQTEAAFNSSSSGIGHFWHYSHDYVRGAIETMTHPLASGEATASTVSRTTSQTFLGATVNGLLVNNIDELGRSTAYTLDSHGRVVSVMRSGTAKTLVTYRADGSVSSILDPNGLMIRYERNLLGWPLIVRAPDLSSTAYQHNARGQVTQSIDARGVIVNSTYDVAGRLTGSLSSSEPANVRRVGAALTYSGVNAPTQFGMLESETADGTNNAYTYTPEMALASIRTTNGMHSGLVKLNYDVGARLASVEYPNTYRVNYTYNLDDSLARVAEHVSNRTIASYLYEDDGQVSVVTSQFGLEEGFTYDNRGRRTSVSSANVLVGSGDLVNDEVSYSRASQVVSLTKRGLRPGLIPRQSPDVTTMAYDSLGRLVRQDVNAVLDAEYKYDVGGRLRGYNEEQTRWADTTEDEYAADKLVARRLDPRTNDYPTQLSVTYDAAGNVSDLGFDHPYDGGYSSTHRWDALGRYARTAINGGETTEYFYTPSGQISRVVKPGAAATTADALHVGTWARKDMSSGNWTNSVVANGSVLAEHTLGRMEFAHRTIQQTVAAVSNDLGEVTRQEEFSPYGQRRAGASTGNWTEGFHGLRSDELVVAGGRAYDPKIGLWLSRDKLPLENPLAVIADPRLGVTYGFVYADPYSRRDPSGRQPNHPDRPSPPPENPYEPPYVAAVRADIEPRAQSAERATQIIKTVGNEMIDYVQLGVSLTPHGRAAGVAILGLNLLIDYAQGQSCSIDPLSADSSAPTLPMRGMSSSVGGPGGPGGAEPTFLSGPGGGVLRVPLDSLRSTKTSVLDDARYARARAEIASGTAGPIRVEPMRNGQFQIADGVRRSTAARELGRTHIDAIVVRPIGSHPTVPLRDVKIER